MHRRCVAAAAIAREHFLAAEKHTGFLGEYDARRRHARRRVRLLVVDNGSELKPALQTPNDKIPNCCVSNSVHAQSLHKNQGGSKK
jgi:hypothetical protein